MECALKNDHHSCEHDFINKSIYWGLYKISFMSNWVTYVSLPHAHFMFFRKASKKKVMNQHTKKLNITFMKGNNTKHNFFFNL